MKVLGYLLLSMFILGLVVNIMKALAILLVVLLLIALILHPYELLNAMIVMGVMAVIRDQPLLALLVSSAVLLWTCIAAHKARHSESARSSRLQ